MNYTLKTDGVNYVKGLYLLDPMVVFNIFIELRELETKEQSLVWMKPKNSAKMILKSTKCLVSDMSLLCVPIRKRSYCFVVFNCKM